MGKSVIKRMTDQTGSALLFTLLISGILMVLALAVITLTNNDYMTTEARADSAKAKYVADSAVEIIKQQIADYETANGEPLTAAEDDVAIADGQYDYRVTPLDSTAAGNLYDILVTARVELANGETARKKIEVTYLQPGSNSGGDDDEDDDDDNGGGNTPPGTKTALDFTVYQGGSSGMLHFDGGQFKCTGDIHSNSRIQLKDNNGHEGLILEGTVSSAKDISLPGDVDLSGVVLKENQPVVPLPVINWNYIRGLPGAKVYYGNTTLTGAMLTGGADQNAVVYVIGDLTITGNVTPNALIVATGNITIIGDCNFPNSDYHVAGVIAGKNINFVEDDAKNNRDETGDWTRVSGFVIALKDLNVKANTKIEGTLVAGSDINISGFLDLQTKQDKPAYEVLQIFGRQVISNSK